MLRKALLGALIVSMVGLAGCNKSEGGDAIGSAAPAGSGSAAAGSAAAKASPGGGFSAELSKELSGSGAATGSATGSGSDAAKPAAGSDGAASPAGASGSDTAKPAALAAGSGSDTAKPAAAASGSGSAAAASAQASTTGSASAGSTSAAAATGSAAPAETAKPVTPAQPAYHPPVKTSAELAAIKLSLLPNWDRDIDAPGTFQYVVRIKGTQNTKTFVFHYGYDDPKAPADRDQYKKFLQDNRILVGEIKDRQRGSAWFLEGTDGTTGLPAFRYIVLYGGKHLICYGSLYKDADGNRLGDDRDQTVIQAKQICETLAL